MGDDHLWGKGRDIIVSDPGDTGVSLHGYKQDVGWLLTEFFQLRHWGAAAAEVMQDFPLEADAPAEHLTFGVVAQQRKIPGQADMYPAEGLEHQPAVELDVPAEKSLDFQTVKLVYLTICPHAMDMIWVQPVLHQRLVHTAATVDHGICFCRDFRYIQDVIEMPMGNQNLVGGLDIRCFQGL